MFVPILNVISPETIALWLTNALAGRRKSLADDGKSSVRIEASIQNKKLPQDGHRMSSVCAGKCLAGFQSDDAWIHFGGELDAAAALAHLKKEGHYLWRVEPGALTSRALDEPVEFILSYAASDGLNVCHAIFFGVPLCSNGEAGFDYVRFGGGSRDPRLVDRKRELTTCGLVPSLREVVSLHFADVAFSGVCFTDVGKTPPPAPPPTAPPSKDPKAAPRQRTPMPHLGTDVRDPVCERRVLV